MPWARGGGTSLENLCSLCRRHHTYVHEYGFRLEKAIADRAVPIVVGYSNGNIGYICTAKAHMEGGYEPNNSQSGPEAEEVLIAESLKLADRVIGDVFESFSPPDATGRKEQK